MKVYNRVVIDMATLDVVDEDSYEYVGEVAELKGGGGGSSGKVSWPGYMMDFHSVLLFGEGSSNYPRDDTPPLQNYFLTVFEDAQYNNPFDWISAYNPNIPLAAIEGELSDFKDEPTPRSRMSTLEASFFRTGASSPVFNIYDWIDNFWYTSKNMPDYINSNSWDMSSLAYTFSLLSVSIANDIQVATQTPENYVSQVNYDGPRDITLMDLDTTIEDAADDFGDELDRQLEETVLPRFKRGMQDINAVISSAFTLGQSVIEEGRTRDVARFMSDLKAKAYLDGRRLDYENENRERELIQEEEHHVRDHKMTELQSYRAEKQKEFLDRRKLQVDRDMDYKRLSMENDREYRNLDFQDKVARREIKATEGFGRRDLYYKDRFHGQDIATKLHHILTTAHNQMMLGGHEIILRQVLNEIEWEKNKVILTSEAMRTKMDALHRQYETNLDIEESESKWGVELFQHASNLLAGPAGGTHGTGKKNPAGGALSGALGGAASGVMAGAAFGPPGMIIGGIAGAAMGGLGGAMG